jgi:hypothetical protein
MRRKAISFLELQRISDTRDSKSLQASYTGPICLCIQLTSRCVSDLLTCQGAYLGDRRVIATGYVARTRDAMASYIAYKVVSFAENMQSISS